MQEVWGEADGENEDAVAEFKEAIQVEPDYVEAYSLLAQAYIGMEDWDDVDETYDAAREIIDYVYVDEGDYEDDPDMGGSIFSISPGQDTPLQMSQPSPSSWSAPGAACHSSRF